jgi:hypothetical protein
MHQEILGALIGKASPRLGGVKSQLFAESTSEARFFAVVELVRNMDLFRACVKDPLPANGGESHAQSRL